MKTARRSRPARVLRAAGTRAIAAVLLGAAGSPASAIPLGDDTGPTLCLAWQRATSISPQRLM